MDLTMEFDSKEILKRDKISRIPDIEEKYRSYILILYPDSTIYDYDEVINLIKGDCKKYAFITHEPESNETKKHTHVVLYFDSARYVKGLEKKWGIPYYYFQLPLTFRGCCRYLTHIDYPEKIQYNIQDVTISKSFLKQFLQFYDDEKLPEQILDDIYQFIEDNKKLDRILLEKQLTTFVCSSAYQKVFRTYYNSIVKFIEYVTSYNIYYVNFYILNKKTNTCSFIYFTTFILFNN